MIKKYDVWSEYEYNIGVERIAVKISLLKAFQIVKREVKKYNPKNIWITEHKNI